MTPPARRLALGLAGLAAVCGAWAAVPGPVGPAAPAPVPIVSQPIPLDSQNPAAFRVGDLVWLGGLKLESESKSFGGYSGLRLLPDGRLLAISDRGHWLAFRPVEDKGRLTGLREATTGPLTDEFGQPLGPPYYDAEALEAVPNASGGLDFLVAFENRHRVWRYAAPPPAPARAEGQAENGVPEAAFATRPKPLAGWLDDWPGGLSGNAGIEALADNGRGMTLLLAEGSGLGRYRLAAGAPWKTIRYENVPGFRPTDAAFLPVEGRRLVLVLSRHFSLMHGVAATLELADLDQVEGGVLSGRLLARLAPPVSVDNMEGLAVAPRPGGGWDVYVMADDNRNPLQRTLLLKFALPDDIAAR